MTDYRELGRRLIGEMNPRLAGVPTRDTGFANELRELSIDIAFGQVWSRPALSRRDRSLVTLGILIALRAESELEHHFPIAVGNGVSIEELEELIYHSAIYAGFPSAHVAQLVGRRTLPATVEDTTQAST
ncbi:carboxymuconolactone decarboxylase family protein [Nonomuraea sp. NPDC005650]|uniref:carboxymuconolactone decarboxylase family protein n=1 Tax=Nonomuraea sp. NPDC005650 TaxID=3157045 RepID=UPI0033B7BFB3